MSHLESQAVFTKMLHIETTEGTELILSNLVHPTPTARDVRPYLIGDPLSYGTGDLKVERHEGWYSRFSAPGYLDCTDWSGPWPTEGEALAELAELA